MTNVNISAYPWLCSTMPKKNTWTCYNDNGNVVSVNEGYNAEAFSTEAYGTFGLNVVYYKISENLRRDKIFGEDPLRKIERAFNIVMYTEQLPPNVRTYQLQGIWGEDVITCYVGITAFKYWSTYGGKTRNTPKVYDDFQPRIGDLIYLAQNDTLYEIRDVKYYTEAFGLQSHTYTLTLKVYKGSKLTIDTMNETLPSSDIIYNYATSALSAQYQMKDVLSNNDILDYNDLRKSKNINHMDVLYNPNKDYETLEAYADTVDERFTDYTNQLREIDEGVDEVMEGMDNINAEFDEFREKTKQKVDELHSYADKIETSAKYVEDNLYKVEYNTENQDD